jgi:Dolichyl-phosphate-mannose-protein mannosyltransferase
MGFASQASPAVAESKGHHQERRLSATSPQWLLASSALLLIMWSFAVPVFEAPDEPHHWNYALYLHQNRRLPFYDSRLVEANQPPLYYAIVAPFASPSSTPPLAVQFNSGRVVPDYPPRLFVNTKVDFGRYWPIRITRLVTCILSLLAVYFAYLSGLEATGDVSTGLLAGGLTAFLPQFTFRGMSISNDALVTTTCAAAVYLIIRLVKRGFSFRLGIVTSALIATAFLSKINAIFLPVPFAIAVLTERGDFWQRWDRLWVLTAGLVIAAPWLVRNQVLYGDPLANKIMWKVVPELIDPKPINSPYFRTVFPAELWHSFIGMFGWLTVMLPAWFYQFFAAVGLLGGIGYAYRLIRRPADRRLAMVLLPIPVLSLVLLIQLNLTFAQPQGRYLFPALTTIAVLVAMGLEALPGWGRRSSILAVITLALINVAALGGTVIPAYWTFPDYYRLKMDASVSPAEMRTPAGPLSPGVSYAQSFVVHHENLTRVDVEFATYSSRIRAGTLKMHLRQAVKGNDIASSTIELNTIQDNSFVKMEFPAIADSKDRLYYIVFEAQGQTQPITVWLSAGDAYPEGSFFVNGEAKPQDTSFRTFYKGGQ